MGITPLDEAFHPIPEEIQRSIESSAGGTFPLVLTWFFSRLGGCHFKDGVLYFDPGYQQDVMLGWFLDAEELSHAFDFYREVLPSDVIPVADDGGGNFLCVGVGPANNGVVYFHVHDAGRGEDGGPAPLDRISDSLEQFLLSLHRES